MISGPTIPRTPDGVRGLIRRHLGLAERGLTLVCEDLELGQGAHVDALARDAAGSPVLVFAAVPGSCQALPMRVLQAQAWFSKHGQFLVSQFEDQGVHRGAAARLLVLGLDFLADTVDELANLGLADLAVHRFCSFTVGGELRVGVTQLVGAELGVGGDAAAMFDPPSGVPRGPAAELCHRFLDLARRMDPRVTAVGDRFSRQLLLGGVPIADLEVADTTPRVRLANGEDHVLDSEEDCDAVVDQLVRQLLAGVTGPPGGPEAEAPSIAEPPLPDPQAGLDEGRFSLEPIRRAVAAAKVSEHEYLALEELEEP